MRTNNQDDGDELEVFRTLTSVRLLKRKELKRREAVALATATSVVLFVMKTSCTHTDIQFTHLSSSPLLFLS